MSSEALAKVLVGRSGIVPTLATYFHVCAVFPGDNSLLEHCESTA